MQHKGARSARRIRSRLAGEECGTMKTPIGPRRARKARPEPAGAIAADTLLLLRLALSDGRPDLRAFALLRRIARSAFHLDDAATDVLTPALESFGSEDPERAANLFRERSREERVQLARLLMQIARQDEMLAAREKRLRGRVAVILGLDETEFGPFPDQAEA
jgi:uncharacterized tellurite resistance protein B-like protein